MLFAELGSRKNLGGIMMLKHVDFLTGVKSSQAVAKFNEFMVQDAPRKIPHLYKRYCRGAMFQVGLILGAIYLITLLVMLILATYNESVYLAVKIMTVFAALAIFFTIIGWVMRCKVVNVLRCGKLIEGKIVSIRQLPYRHDSLTCSKLYIEYPANNGNKKVAKVVVSDTISSTFKDVMDKDQNPYVDILEYKGVVIVPLMFILGSRYE